MTFYRTGKSLRSREDPSYLVQLPTHSYVHATILSNYSNAKYMAKYSITTSNSTDTTPAFMEKIFCLGNRH